MFTAVSVYAAWEKVGGRKYADGSAHRILSDLSALALDRRLRLIVAGDWNLLRGYGEHGDDYWRARYDTVFSRAEALNLRFVGPEYPNGRRADPWPQELPPNSLCVPNVPPRSPVAIDGNQTTGLRVSLGAPGPVHPRSSTHQSAKSM